MKLSTHLWCSCLLSYDLTTSAILKQSKWTDCPLRLARSTDLWFFLFLLWHMGIHGAKLTHVTPLSRTWIFLHFLKRKMHFRPLTTEWDSVRESEEVWHFVLFHRQGGKDQTKKGQNIKLGPQGDKKGLGQDPRKDGSMDSGHHLKVQLHQSRNIKPTTTKTICPNKNNQSTTAALAWTTKVWIWTLF